MKLLQFLLDCSWIAAAVLHVQLEKWVNVNCEHLTCSRGRGQVRADHPADPEPLRGRVRPHHRGQLQEAGRHRRGDVSAGHPGHRGPGGVQRHAGPVHEDRRGIPHRVRRQQHQVVRGHHDLPRADQAGEGRGGGADGDGGEQVRPAHPPGGHAAGAGRGQVTRDTWRHVAVWSADV